MNRNTLMAVGGAAAVLAFLTWDSWRPPRDERGQSAPADKAVGAHFARVQDKAIYGSAQRGRVGGGRTVWQIQNPAQYAKKAAAAKK